MKINALGHARGRSFLLLLLFVVGFYALQQSLSWLILSMLRTDAFELSALATLIAAVVAGLAQLVWLEKQPAARLGFALRRKGALQFAVGVALGVGALAIACIALLAFGALRYENDSGSVGGLVGGMVLMLLVLAIPAAAEEALFRGYPFQKLVETFGPLLATVAASVGFAVAHSQNPSVNGFALVNIFVAGIMLSFAYLRTRSLWFATGVHLGWNWSMAGLFDLPVSGLELFDAPLYEPVARGPAWFTGGAFGPEAGLAGLLGLTLALGGVFWITRNKEWLI